MKKNRFISGSIAFLAALLLIVSCKPPVEPTPGFSFSIDDKTVTFTNLSTDATTYSWDFGDASAASVEENPVHVYDAYGDYDVRLTATGEGGTVIKKTTISVVKEWPEITIDGDFSDWDSVETFYSGYGDASGTLTEAKVTSNSSYSKLYIYVKGTMNADFPVVQIVFNSDGDITTGWTDTISGYQDNGAELMFEFDVTNDFSSIWEYAADGDPGWPWDTEVTSDLVNGDISETSGIIGESEIEFVIETPLIPQMSTEKIGIFFWQQPEDWSSTSGSLPPLHTYPLENVKLFSFQ